jgi:hypothetical protein
MKEPPSPPGWPSPRLWDDQLRPWISDTEVAKAEYTAFTSCKGRAITARLIVRRVKDLSRNAVLGQGELFTAWHYHALFTDPTVTMLQVEKQHRGHAQAGQVFADWSDGLLAHLLSGSFPRTRPGWRSLPSAATCCRPPDPWPARGATLRDLISLVARTARHGRGHIGTIGRKTQTRFTRWIEAKIAHPFAALSWRSEDHGW